MDLRNTAEYVIRQKITYLDKINMHVPHNNIRCSRAQALGKQYSVFRTINSRACKVFSETSFVSKQPKLEPKLVSALSETRNLFQLFRFNIETGSFGISKQ
jgi:hypothetical protein